MAGPDRLKGRTEKVRVAIEGQRELFRDPSTGALISVKSDRRAEKALLRETIKNKREESEARKLKEKNDHQELVDTVKSLKLEMKQLKKSFNDFVDAYNKKGKP